MSMEQGTILNTLYLNIAFLSNFWLLNNFDFWHILL